MAPQSRMVVIRKTNDRENAREKVNTLKMQIRVATAMEVPKRLKIEFLCDTSILFWCV